MARLLLLVVMDVKDQQEASHATCMRLSPGKSGIRFRPDFAGSLVLCWGCAEPFQSRCRARN